MTNTITTPEDKGQQNTFAVLSNAADYIRQVQADFGLEDNGTLAEIEAELKRLEAEPAKPE